MAHVLLVDDDPDQVEVRTLILEAEGYRVSGTRNRRRAVEVFRESPPDIVLMDLRLPRTEDGVSLINSLRELSATVPIIVLSGWPADIRDHPVVELVSEVMPKPVRTQNLLTSVRRLTA